MQWVPFHHPLVLFFLFAFKQSWLHTYFSPFYTHILSVFAINRKKYISVSTIDIIVILLFYTHCENIITSFGWCYCMCSYVKALLASVKNLLAGQTSADSSSWFYPSGELLLQVCCGKSFTHRYAVLLSMQRTKICTKTNRFVNLHRSFQCRIKRAKIKGAYVSECNYILSGLFS